MYNEITRKQETPKGINKMDNNKKFYICEKCGNIVEIINDSGVNPHCCGQKMSVLEAGVVEASREKHIPEVELSEGRVKVSVGSIEHPMAEEHSILWIYLQTNKGGQRKNLKVGDHPVAVFALDDEKPVAVYAYCNLHGLWKKEI